MLFFRFRFSTHLAFHSRGDPDQISIGPQLPLVRNGDIVPSTCHSLMHTVVAHVCPDSAEKLLLPGR